MNMDILNLMKMILLQLFQQMLQKIVLNYFCNKYNNYYIINNYYIYFYFINYNIMQSNILNIENWSSYKDEVGTHYTYKINNHYTYELYIGYDNIILDNDLYNLTICKIEKDDYYDIEKWLCLDKELSYCLNIAKENYKTYKNK